MKVRNRDPNIFSMSALDLFASALGAFIVLAVIALPFFPNTSQLNDEQLLARIAEVEQERDAMEAELEAAETDNERLAETVERLEVQDMDLVVVIDVTASMGDTIEGIQTETDNLIRVMQRIAPSLGFGVITFGDRDFQCIVTVHRPLTGCGPGDGYPPARLQVADLDAPDQRAELNNYLNRTLELNLGKGTGGHSNERPEEIHLAMEQVLEIQWRQQSEERHVVVFTDAPARSGFKERALAATRSFANTPGNFVSTVQTEHTNLIGETRETLQAIADAGNGHYVDQTQGDSILVALLLAVLRDQH
jgi:hypothetical protein